MKKLSVKMLLSLLLALSAISLFAQQDPPLPPGDASGNDNKAPRNGAPLGSGIGLLLAMGAAYGGKKVYDYRKHKKELSE